MIYRSDAFFKDIGMRSRAVRQEISLTMEVTSKETGIFRSYLSDFERGFRLPTSKGLDRKAPRQGKIKNHWKQ